VRALVCRAFGEPDGLILEEVADPEPGPGEVVVAIEAAAVNFPDVLHVAGRYQVQLPLPFVPGSEFAGRVVDVGPEVGTALTVGQAVRGSVMSGAFADRIAVPAAMLSPVPENVAPEAAAAFGVTYTTAFHALHTSGHVEADRWVTVLGAAGGVGLAAIELAALAGARVVAVASTEVKRAACLATGAAIVLDGASERLKDDIKDATGGGADLVVDPVGGDQTELALRALRPGGRHIVVGFASGTIPSIPLNLVLVKGVSIVGLDLRHVFTVEPERVVEAAGELDRLLATGAIRPHIGARFDLTDAAAALQLVADRGAIGKVLVTP
jgi:NADPH:quinone reductase